MVTLKGIGSSEGFAVGPISFYDNTYQQKISNEVLDAQIEIDRYINAKKEVISDLECLYSDTLKQFGEKEAEIFKIHQMMIEDNDYCESIINTIKSESKNAETAVDETSKKFADMFMSIDDEYMKSRSEDVNNISHMILNVLAGKDSKELNVDAGSIVFAHDLTPGEISKLKMKNVAGFVIEEGSKNSHVSILARMLEIPAIVGAKGIMNESFLGKKVAFDGSSGFIYIDPDNSIVEEFNHKNEELFQLGQKLNEIKEKEAISLDGKRISVFANLNTEDEIEEVKNSAAEGIGLFRTEFLYLGRDTYPTEEEQFKVYKNVARQMAGKQVVIRTMDIGSDKQEKYMNFSQENNPALGYRGIRVCLDRTEIFKTQLRAIYRASIYGNIAVMLPMIVSPEEVKKAKECIQEVKNELSGGNIEFDNNVKVGVMIETPSAAVMSDVLAQESDFFSIGTNDLTQYTLAADRQNGAIGEITEGYIDPILRLIKITVNSAHKAGIDVCICGEMAGNAELTDIFLKMGVDKLSVSPRYVLRIKNKILLSNTQNVDINF